MECSWAVLQLKTGKVTLGGAFGHGHRVFEASARPPSSNPARRLSLWPNDSKAAGQARSSRPPRRPKGTRSSAFRGRRAAGGTRCLSPAVCHQPCGLGHPGKKRTHSSSAIFSPILRASSSKTIELGAAGLAGPALASGFRWRRGRAGGRWAGPEPRLGDPSSPSSLWHQGGRRSGRPDICQVVA